MCLILPRPRRVMMAFLDKYGRDDLIEDELDLPEWDETLVQDLTEVYEEDTAEIAGMDGVRLIVP